MDKLNNANNWKEYYPDFQDEWCNNFLIKLALDPGHRFIAHEGRDISGQILDIGCGNGYHAHFERIDASRNYIALDIDEQKTIKISKPYIQKVVADCCKTPFQDRSIDLIIASHILEHLPNLPKALEEFNRILKTNGKLIVVIPCDPGWLWKFLTSFTPSRIILKKRGVNYDEMMKTEHINSFNNCLETIKKYFTIKKIRYLPLYIHNYNLNILCGLVLSPKDDIN
ncbi:MAG: class I SAM-dependent methyltransferase [candidate division WWE3 bacterium]|nr:class I SAM-dependent methyltransferase [candidate division WWE3 bacterium]